MSNSTFSPCTVGDLVDNGALGLRVISGAASAMGRPVVAAQIYSSSADEDRLAVGELVLLTSGWGEDPAEPARLADVFQAAGTAAVGLPDTIEDEFAARLAEEIGLRGVVALAVPRTTRFADVIDSVSRAHASPDTARFQRMVSMQQSLVASLDSDEPTQALIERLAKLVDGIAGVADDAGTVETNTGALPYVLFRSEIGAFEAPMIDLQVAGWQAIATRLHTPPHRPQRWLFVASRREMFIDAYSRAAAGVTAALIDAAKRIDVLSLNQDRAVRRSVLNRALSLAPFESSEVLAERAAALGLTFTDDVRILVMMMDHSRRRSQKLKVPLHELVYDDLLDGTQVVFAAERADAVLVLLQAPEAARERALTILTRATPGLHIGIGRQIARIDEVPVSHNDALLAAQYAIRSRDKRVIAYDDLEFSVRLLADVGREKMASWADQILGPLRGKPALLEALERYFEHDQDILKAAATLGIHPNTMRYRITKIEELAGGSLRKPSVVTAFHLALAAASAMSDILPAEAAPLVPSSQGDQRVADVVPDSSPTDTPRYSPYDQSFGAASNEQ